MPRYSIYCHYTLPVAAIYTVEAKNKAEARRMFKAADPENKVRDECCADVGLSSQKVIDKIVIDRFGRD